MKAKKILSVLLSAALMLSMLTMSVMAAPPGDMPGGPGGPGGDPTPITMERSSADALFRQPSGHVQEFFAQLTANREFAGSELSSKFTAMLEGREHPGDRPGAAVY